ncbi:MAG TPA: rhomboid family intramembrane serine protease [Magnetospirillaceae bacterium]|nr:rhomboid family intramembrane serine protease [Magnetospirillaceae bacterium]
MNPDAIIRRPFRYRNHNAVLVLIAVNVGVYLLSRVSRGFLVSMAMSPALVMQGRFWLFFTYMFAHGSISHLFFNMLGLFFFGTHVERELGTYEFLLFYFLTGILAGVFSFAAYAAAGGWFTFLIGASGAVYAVLLAFAALFPGAVIHVWGILPVRAPVLVLAYTGIELASEVFAVRSGVAHLTHLAGFGFSYLYLLIRLGINPARMFFRRDR